MTDRRARRVRIAHEIRGPLVTLLVLILFDIFNHLAIRIPNPAPIYLTAVVYAAFVGGLRPGLISAGLTMLYAAYFFSTPHTLFQYTPDNALRVLILVITTPIMTVMVGVLKNRLENRARQLQALNQKLEALAGTDALTQLKNRRVFTTRLNDEMHRVRRFRRPTSLLLLDVDDFKNYNDSFGHTAGDELLRMMGKVLQDNTRVTDCVARYGGEEFAVILSETDRDASIVSAERFRKVIEGTPWPQRPVTASFGVATLTPERLLSQPRFCDTDLVAEADQALYYSKKHGRNRVTHIDTLAAGHQ